MNYLYRTFLILFFLGFCHIIQIKADDSIRIVGYNYDFEKPFALPRHTLYENIQNDKDHIDTLITDAINVRTFYELIKHLEFVEKLNVDSKEYEWDSVCVQTKYGPRFIPREINHLDNRLYIETYHNELISRYWVSTSMIDIHYKRYLLSYDLIIFLSHYTQLWKEYLNIMKDEKKYKQ